MNFREYSNGERSISTESWASYAPSADSSVRVAAAIAQAHSFAYPHAEGSAWAPWPEPPKPQLPRRPASARRPSTGRPFSAGRPASAGPTASRPASAGRPSSATRRLVQASYANTTRMAWEGRREIHAERSWSQQAIPHEGPVRAIQPPDHFEKQNLEIERLQKIVLDKEAELVVLKRNERRIQEEPWERMRTLTDALNRRRDQVSDLSQQLHDATKLLSHKEAQLDNLGNEKRLAESRAEDMAKENIRLLEKIEKLPAHRKAEGHVSSMKADGDAGQAGQRKISGTNEHEDASKSASPKENELLQIGLLNMMLKEEQRRREAAETDRDQVMKEKKQLQTELAQSRGKDSRKSPHIGPRPSSRTNSPPLEARRQGGLLERRQGAPVAQRRSNKSSESHASAFLGRSKSPSSDAGANSPLSPLLSPTQRRVTVRPSPGKANGLESRSSSLSAEVDADRGEASAGEASPLVATKRSSLRSADDSGAEERLMEAEQRILLLSEEVASGRTLAILGALSETRNLSEADLEIAALRGQVQGLKEENLELKKQVADARRKQVPSGDSAAVATGQDTATDPAQADRIAELEAARDNDRLHAESLQAQLGECRQRMQELNGHLSRERPSLSSQQVHDLKDELITAHRELDLARSDPLSLFMHYNGIQPQEAQERSLSSKQAEVERERVRMYPNLQKTVEAFEGYTRQLHRELLDARFQVTKWQKSKWDVDTQNEELQTRLGKSLAEQSLQEHSEQRRLKLVDVLNGAREEFVQSLMEAGQLLEEKEQETGSEEALKRFQKAAELIAQLQESKQEGQPLELALALMHMGQIRLRQGEKLEAKKLFSRSLEIRQKKLGLEHPLTLDINSLIRRCDAPAPTVSETSTPKQRPRAAAHAVSRLSSVDSSLRSPGKSGFTRMRSAESGSPSRTVSRESSAVSSAEEWEMDIF